MTRIGSLFSGYGGLDMGVQMALGGTVAWNVEFDQAPSKILAHHDNVPNYGDITGVDWAAVEPVDVLTGGFPCQDLSHAGLRKGLRPGTRSGLWEHFAYAIDQLRPRLVVIENVRGLLSASAHCELERDCWCVGDEREPALRAHGVVLGQLAELGYDARWGGVRAADAGAPHGRFRVFIVAQPADAAIDGLAQRGVHQRDERPTTTVRADPGAGPGVTLAAANTHVAGREAWRALWTVAARDLAPSLLPTPQVSDALGAKPVNAKGRNAAGYGYQLRELPQVDFGPYAPAIARWEAVLGRPAPSPTEPGRDGRPRLSPLFVEWLMGLPAGHVTDPGIGLTRAQQLKALGNGVVPQQAALALRLLLGLGGGAVSGGGDLLPTPTAQTFGTQHGKDPNRATVYSLDAMAAKGMLLPTPAVNDMGAGKTPADWDRWTADMQARHGNGNGHGKSLAIEALRLGASDELA